MSVVAAGTESVHFMWEPKGWVGLPLFRPPDVPVSRVHYIAEQAIAADVPGSRALRARFVGACRDGGGLRHCRRMLVGREVRGVGGFAKRAPIGLNLGRVRVGFIPPFPRMSTIPLK